MSKMRRVAFLIILSVAMLTIACVVWVINRDTSSDLLAAGLLACGLAAMVVALPNGNGNGNGKKDSNVQSAGTQRDRS